MTRNYLGEAGGKLAGANPFVLFCHGPALFSLTSAHGSTLRSSLARDWRATARAKRIRWWDLEGQTYIAGAQSRRCGGRAVLKGCARRGHFSKLAASELRRLRREIAAAAAEINNLVCELYGITGEERKLIEEG